MLAIPVIFRLTMFDSKAKIKTHDFLRHVQILARNSSDRIVSGFQQTEKELIKKFTSETEDLINDDEWGVGLQNLLSNLYEIEFPLDRKAVDLAKEAIRECKMDFAQWRFIEELVR